jgi:hypothetical protein
MSTSAPTKVPTTGTPSVTPTRNPTLDFIPEFNSITTNDVSYPGAFIILMMFFLWVYTPASFTWIYRTLRAMMYDEYAYSTKGSDTATRSRLLGFVRDSYFTNLTFGALVIAAFWGVWQVYVNKMGSGGINIPRDVFAVVMSSYDLTLLLLYYFLLILDLSRKHRRIVAMDNDLVATLSTVSATRTYKGMNANTSPAIRLGLWAVNTILWGAVPVSSVMMHSAYVPTDEQYFNLTNGILLSFTWLWHSLVNLGPLVDEYYKELGRETVAKVPHTAFEGKVDPKWISLGFASEVWGNTLAALKGQIPVQYVMSFYMAARCLHWYAVGFNVYNDELQATALFLCVGFLPLLMTVSAGSNSFYPVYETVCKFWFIMGSYLIQNIYATNTAANINWNLMTVNQNSNTPGALVQTSYGMSIKFIYGSVFALSVVACLTTVFSRPLVAKVTKGL